MIRAFRDVFGSLFHAARHSEQSGATHVDTLGLPSTRHREQNEESLNEILRLKPQDDVYHPTLSMFDNNHRAAFTLAEVLITLGIIGIVAAMTIPTLISNYNKRQTVTKLKQTYSILSQALTMAQVKEGDPTTWDVAGIYRTPVDDPNFDREETLEKFMTKYLMPYIKVSKVYGVTIGSYINYDGFYYPSGRYIGNASGYCILLSNNVLLFTSIGTSGCVTNPDGSCATPVTFGNFIFYVDINGFSKPNTYGKDVFMLEFNLTNKQLGFYHRGQGKNTLLRDCGTDGGSTLCGRLIYIDGWQIKDDYPWF